MVQIAQPAPFSNAPTDEQIDFNRRMGARLMQQGTSTEPVGHWSAALARALQGLSGGMYAGQAAQGEQEAEASVAQALSGNMDPRTLIQNPRTRAYGMNMLASQQAEGRAEARERRAEERRLRDPLYQAQIAQAQANTDQLRAQQRFDREFLSAPTAPAEVAPALGAAAAAGREAEMPLPATPPQTDGARLRAAVNALPPDRQATFLALWRQGDRKSALSLLDGGGADYGKSGAVFQGQDGTFYTVQFGSRGERKIVPVEVNGQSLAPARGVQTIDDGTGTRIISGATGAQVGRVEKDIVGREKAEAVGKAAGELEVTFPKATAALRSVSEGQRVVMTTIDDAINRVNGFSAGLAGTLLSKIGGTEATDLKRALLTIKGNIGFDKLQDMRANSPTGGALGQVAVQELETLQSVLGSLEQDQTPAQLRRNLLAVRDTLQRFQRLREQAYEETYRPILQTRQQAPPRMEFPNLPPGVTIERVGP